MAIRNDISIRWDLTPRLIIIDASSSQISMQDLIDTLRTLEAHPGGIDEPFILNSSGKEDLGGGTSVGLTVELQNAQIYFEERSWQEYNGIITTSDPNGEFLIDASQSFESSKVFIGHTVSNVSTHSLATLISNISPTKVKTLPLSGSIIRNDWLVGDEYIIYHNELCSTAGGNLVAIDSSGNSLYPILQSPNVQSTLTSSSSATLQNQAATEYASFGNRITVDKNSAYSGTSFPIGTGLQPVNNIPDARRIALTRGFSTFFIRNDYTFGLGDNIEDFSIIGINPGQSSFIFNIDASTSNAEIQNATIQGKFDGAATFINCHINDVSAFNGTVQNSVLFGTIQLTGVGRSLFLNCTDGQIVSGNPPTIDFGGSGSNVAVRNYHGDLQLSNKTGPENVEINMTSGASITILDSVINGTIKLTGIIDVLDFSSGDASINIHNVIFPDQTQLSAYAGHVFVDISNGTTGTKFPIGTNQFPSNNLTDAKNIAEIRGISMIQFKGDLIIGSSDNINNFNIIGDNQSANLFITSGASTNNVDLNNLNLYGDLSGSVVIRESTLTNITGFEGIAFNSILQPGTIKLSGTSDSFLLGCYSGVTGQSTPILDMGGSGRGISIRNYTGGITITNKTGPESISIDMGSGQIKLDSSVAGSGDIVLRGVGELTQNDASTSFTLINQLNSDITSSKTVNKVIPIIYSK